MDFRNMGSTDERDARHPPPPPPPAAAPSAAVGLASVYSLTFDEFQSTMGGFGKDFGSMNMDEFLKNVWTAEESQAMAAGSAAGPSGVAGGLQRQGSLSLPRTLSQKTVDEVWRDLAAVQGGGDFRQQREPTLGEMTLEEFLVQAGVVREDMDQSVNQQQQQHLLLQRPIVSNGNTSDNNNNMSSIFYPGIPASNSNQGIVLGFGQAGRSSRDVVQSQIANGSAVNLAMGGGSSRPYRAALTLGNAADMVSPQRMGGGGIVGIGDPMMNTGLMQGMVGLGGGVTVAATASPANQMSSDGLGKGNGDLSSLSPVPYAFNGGIRGKRISGTVEKVVERRQRRMIKNRESAARSRARKQAYTMELEAEIAKLKELNEELQKKQEIMEMQKKQVLELINQQHGTKKRCLRRTLTGPW